MQRPLPSWRNHALKQGRCCSLSRRPYGTKIVSQVDSQDHRPHLVNVSFKVEYKCPYGQSLALVGNTASLGNWTSKRGQRMHWSRGDVWTCNVMLPAGSDIECKYVIVDEQGKEQRWQEGSNMIVKIPATCHGLPVQRYEVGMSWCKNFAKYRAQTLTSAVAMPAEEAAPAATAAPVMAWAMSKGASTLGRPNPAALAHQAAEAQAMHIHSPIVAVGATASPLTSPAALSAQPPLLTAPEAAELLFAATASPMEVGSGSKVATLVQAAASVIRSLPVVTDSSSSVLEATLPATGAATASTATSGPLPSFQMSQLSDGSESTMSLVLPPRSKSPPVKISLSSNFSKLMDMPALNRGSSGGSGTSSVNLGVTASAVPAVNTVGGSTVLNSKGTTHDVMSHAIEVNLPANRENVKHLGGSSEGVSRDGVTSDSCGSKAASSSNKAVRGSGRSLSHNKSAPSMLSAPAIPLWGMEYDIYAAAYGLPYIHTPFDLDAYAVYDQSEQESSSLKSSSSARLSPSKISSHGSIGFLSESQSRDEDPLELAVQAALSSVPSPSNIVAPSAEVMGSAVANATSALDITTSTHAGPAPLMSNAALFTPQRTYDDSIVAREVTGDAAPMDAYRQVSKSSTSVSDWVGRTLIEMSSGRSLIDEDSDEDETADDEAAIAQALAAPAAPADMAALLTQLGTALGRSVRLRYDGIDATAQDLLELDRKIALAASKLYRQRDSLLTGWLRTETRRQLSTAAAATPGTRPSMPTSTTVTPL